MGKIALLVIDVQNLLVDGNPFDIDIVLKNIKSLIENCREKSVEVIYVQHTDTEVDGELQVGTYEWQIHNDIKPNENEVIFRKNYNSSFRKTGLKDYLDKQKIESLIITGMQTEYCIDTTCRVAFEYGFDIIIPEKTNTTFDKETIKASEIYDYHNYSIFKNRFAKVESLDIVKNMIN
ncbi:MAG: cysteine hydrolase family protein [Sarcina sp.]